MAKHSIFLLILAVVSLIALGITMMASTTFEIAQEGGEDYVTLWRQLVWLGVGSVGCVVMALVDYHVWLRWRWHILIIAADTAGTVLCTGHRNQDQRLPPLDRLAVAALAAFGVCQDCPHCGACGLVRHL